MIKLFLSIFLFLLCSCAGMPPVQRVMPHFILEKSINTDILNPADIYADGEYIFILDGTDQTIKRFNGEIQFGGFGTDKETFLKAVSIDGIKGNIFILDKSARRIKIFDTDGNYISEFPVDEIESPSEMALDGFGRLYILDKTNFKIYIYTEEGKYINEFGAYGWGAGFLHSPVSIAYDNQYLYILDDKRISIFDPDGNYIKEISLKQKGKDIAVDGYIYVLMDNGVIVYTNTGGEAGKITGKWNKIYARKNRIYLAKGKEIDIYSR